MSDNTRRTRPRKPFVHLLGTPKVRHPRQTDGAVQQKHWALLTYVLATGQPVGRETLITLLWPDALEKQGKISLRVALTALRKKVGEALESDHLSVGIDHTKMHCDLTILRTWHKAGAPPDDVPYDLNVTRDLLEGLILKDAPGFMDWLDEERSRVRRDAHDAWLQAAQTLHETLGAEEALTLVETASQIQPWEEATHRVAIRLLAEAGHLEEAVQRYFRTERELDQHLDAEPSRDTNDLLRTIRQRLLTPKAAEAVPEGLTDGLPRSEHGIVGRERDLLSVLDRLEHLTVSLLTIHGPPGVGTSALACEAARLHARTHGITTRYVSLRNTEDVTTARHTIFQALETDKDTLAGALVVLDDVTPGALNQELLDDVQEAFGIEHFLATSHTVLGLVGDGGEESSWALSHLAPPPLNPLDDWDFVSSPSVAVFLAAATRAGWSGYASELTFDQKNLIHLTCRTLQGHPLSLVHAGRAWAEGRLIEPVLTMKPIATNVCVDRVSELPSTQQSLLHHGLAFVQALPDEVQTMSAKYAPVGVPFTSGFVASVLDSDVSHVRRELRHLAHVGVVSRNPSGAPPETYVLPPQIRAALLVHVEGAAT